MSRWDDEDQTGIEDTTCWLPKCWIERETGSAVCVAENSEASLEVRKFHWHNVVVDNLVVEVSNERTLIGSEMRQMRFQLQSADPFCELEWVKSAHELLLIDLGSFVAEMSLLEVTRRKMTCPHNWDWAWRVHKMLPKLNVGRTERLAHESWDEICLDELVKAAWKIRRKFLCQWNARES